MPSSTSLPSALLPLTNFGFFTWSVCENLLYGDPVLAAFYELDVEALAAGIGVETILALIANDDRERLAREIHAAILSGEPAASRYSVALPSGRTNNLVSFGRCFRDACGVPSYYAGAVTIADISPIVVGSDPLEAHCRAALAIAKAEGNELTARYLSSALGSIGRGATS